MIRNLRVITVENREVKLEGFASDPTTFMRGIQSYDRVLATLNISELCSALISHKNRCLRDVFKI